MRIRQPNSSAPTLMTASLTSTSISFQATDVASEAATQSISALGRRRQPRPMTTLAPIVFNAPSVKIITAPSGPKQDCAIGFIGLFFSTFFGGHNLDWPSPEEQYTYFRDFKMRINR